jgi:zinc-dependent metalloproteinase lipoprotein
MKQILVLFLGLVLVSTANSQLNKNKVKRCYTVERIKKIRSTNPNIQSDQQFEEWLQPLVKQHKQKKNAINYRLPVLNYTLPVIFHVVHNNEAVGSGNNVSAARIQAQILQLNKDFANLSGSPYASASNSGIQFALATKDPSGNTLSEPGIERIRRNTKGWTAPPYTDTYIDATIKPNSYWDPTKYLNIWLLDMSITGNEILGFATFPSASTLSGLDNDETAETAGLAIDPTTVGSVFTSTTCGSTTSPYTLGKTLTHEIGHFLGLRHIWGDANCGTDYCDDTPIHYEDNYGKPAHPKSNSCGTADEMFENYMDYTDDDVLNTFTADQVDRMQTVLLNSTRRKTLPTSTVGFTFPAGSNKVAFALCAGAITVSETGNAGTTSRYRDIPLALNVENVATGNATLTFNVTGTAVNGVDYLLLSNTLNFIANDASKTVILRILDNVTNDVSKNLTITYNISGNGVTSNTTAQSLNVTIIDNDVVNISNNAVNLFANNFDSNTSIWTTLDDGGSNVFTISNNGSAGGSGACAHITNNTITRPNVYDNTNASVAILSSPLINAQGYKNLSLRFKYRVYGETDADGTYDFGAVTYAPESDATGFNTILDGPYVGATAAVSGTINTASVNALAGTKFYLGFYWENDNNIGNNPGLNIDDVVLTADGTKIETTLSSSYTYSVSNSSANSYFKSTSNDYVIAMVKSLGTSVNNITASVTEAGTDRLNITSGNSTFLRSRKVIKLAPTSADNTTANTTTIYFANAEVAAWPNATTLKVIKIKDGTLPSDNLNSNNSVLLTPTVDDQRTANGFIAYTFTTTGFGSYVLVDGATVLPVSLVSFDATAEKNSVLLTWSTSSEINNVGFDVQRSTNGTAFTTIGFVASKGTGANTYSFNDGAVVSNTKYYYRLLQKDADGKTGLSNVVSVVFNGESSNVRITPNPVKNLLTIRYNVPTTVVDVVIMDVLGRKVFTTKASGTIQVNTEAWTKGGYFVQVNDGNSVQSYKVIKD